MGKGYNNYMCKKPFHPGSKANIKRTWMAEQKTENEKRKQDDLKLQYEKEQDLYNNKALLSKESKDKLGLNFMYEAPPGAKKERQKEDDEPEYKFEWQRKYNAPREEFAKDNKDIRDQPFGIQVRNVRCIKCHKWGHINTDKECPLYNKASNTEISGPGMDPLDLMRRMMEEDGLALKQNVLGRHIAGDRSNQELIPSDDEEDIEAEFLKTLTTKQKKKLLRKLEKLEKSKKKHTKKKKDQKKKRKHQKASDSGSKSRKSKSKKRKGSSSSSDDESTTSSDDSDVSQSKRKRDSSENERSGSEKHPSNSSKDHHSQDEHYSSSSSKRAKKQKNTRADSSDDEKHNYKNIDGQSKHYKEDKSKSYHFHDTKRYKDSYHEKHQHSDSRYYEKH